MRRAAKVDFKNAIVIMTSNIGARDIVKGQSLGFAPWARARACSTRTSRTR